MYGPMILGIGVKDGGSNIMATIRVYFLVGDCYFSNEPNKKNPPSIRVGHEVSITV